MATKNLLVNYPSDILLALNETSDEFERDYRFFAAVKFYELGKLSLGQASILAGMDKIDFVKELGKYNIPIINYSLESLQDEMETVEKLANEK